QNQSVDPNHLDQMIDFIRIFADKCHHGKEEDLLFVAMEKVGIPRDGGPIGVMLSEHTIGRNFVKGMAEATEQLNGQKAKFVENARGYVQLLREHIMKEDNILYPMANQRFTDENQKELLKQFADVEKTVIGEGKHEEYYKLLEHLKSVYLPAMTSLSGCF
ncbi:MAG: hemerythrin domain-containing protein, partial [Candidatus Heimdallarchaeota archaeon]